MNQLRNYQAVFTEKYPAAGDIRTGVRASGEQLGEFADIIGSRIAELSRKPELTKTEATFIDRTMDLAVRSVIYTHERFGIPIPESENTVATAQGIAGLQGSAPAPQDIVYGLHSITGSMYSLRDKSAYRTPIENIAYGSLHMLGEMADTADGLQVDQYLEGNLQNIVAHFEQTEQQ